jgi:hypothetical protein
MDYFYECDKNLCSERINRPNWQKSSNQNRVVDFFLKLTLLIRPLLIQTPLIPKP